MMGKWLGLSRGPYNFSKFWMGFIGDRFGKKEKRKKSNGLNGVLVQVELRDQSWDEG